MEKREFSSSRESKCKQVYLELLLKDGDVISLRFSESEFQSLGAVMKKPLSP